MAVSNYTLPANYVPPSSGGVGAVMEAFANAADVSSTAQIMANSDLASSDFMNRLYKMLSQFGGDMQAIQAFLSSYVAFHSQEGQSDRLSGDSGLSVMAVSEMLGKLKTSQDEMDSLQKTLNSQTSEVTDLTLQLADIGVEMEPKNVAIYAAKYAGWTCIWGPIGAAAMAAVASARYACLAVDFKNVSAKLEVAQKQLDETGSKLGAVQKEQTALVSGTTGKINTSAGAISGMAKASLNSAAQVIQLGFMFLSVMGQDQH